MSDHKQGGVVMKYLMFRADGTLLNEDACYFVLRLDKDPNARTAAKAYAKSVRKENEELADDITDCLDELAITSADCTCGGRAEVSCKFHDSPMFGSKVWRYGEPTKPSYAELTAQLEASRKEVVRLREELSLERMRA